MNSDTSVASTSSVKRCHTVSESTPNWTNASCWVNRCSGSAQGEVDGAAGPDLERVADVAGGRAGLEAPVPERQLPLGGRRSTSASWP